MATVHTILSTSPTPALLIAVVADLSVSAVSVGSIVAAVKGKVPHHELSLVISVASQMNWIRILFQTVPILPRNGQKIKAQLMRFSFNPTGLKLLHQMIEYVH